MVLLRYFSEIDEEEIPRSVFYSIYNDADCSEGIGNLAAYGYKDGKYYHGEVPCRSLKELPDDGIWYSSNTAVEYDVESTGSMDLNRIRQICTELCTLSSLDYLDVDEDEVSSFLNHLQIHNRKEFEKYVSLLQQLVDLTGGECFYEEGYANPDGDDVRVILLSVRPNSTPSAEIMEPYAGCCPRPPLFRPENSFIKQKSLRFPMKTGGFFLQDQLWP